MTTRRPRSTDRAAGLIGTIGGVTVVLFFLLFAVQLLIGLYANTTVVAIATDSAQRAAGRDANRSDAALETYQRDAEASLGGVNGRVDFSQSADTDGDGDLDLIVVRVTADAPRFVPAFLGGNLGIETIEETVRIDVEDFVSDEDFE
jgi:hypothetical protein